jgi:hypothetical protein
MTSVSDTNKLEKLKISKMKIGYKHIVSYASFFSTLLILLVSIIKWSEQVHQWICFRNDRMTHPHQLVEYEGFNKPVQCYITINEMFFFVILRLSRTAECKRYILCLLVRIFTALLLVYKKKQGKTSVTDLYFHNRSIDQIIWTLKRKSTIAIFYHFYFLN